MFNSSGLRLSLWLFVAAAWPVIAQVPRVDSITPPQGPISGGTVVTIRGANLERATLTLDNVPIATTAVTPTELRFSTPAHDNGIASIRLAGPAGSSYGEFLYVPPRLADLPPGYVTTIAGIGRFRGDFRPATQAEVDPMGEPAFDGRGNLYVPEPNYNRVSRVRPDGVLEPFAGDGREYLGASQDAGDGRPATQAVVNFPRGVTTDADGNVYIAESAPRLRKVDGRAGVISTIAGNGSRGFSGDGGPALQAQLNEVTHITGDGRGTVFFIDFDGVSGAGRIRRVTPDGIITTVAGTGTPGFSGDGGPATAAQFNFVYSDNGSLARDPQGNLFVADVGNSRVRRIDARSGVITTFFGPTPVNEVGAVATDAAGNLFVGGFNALRIVKLDPAGQVVASYGNGRFPGFSVDGTPIADTYISSLAGLTVDPANNIVYVEQSFARVRRLNFVTGVVETVAGIAPQVLGDNGPAIGTLLPTPGGGGVAVLPNGDVLVGDTGHQLIRRVDRAGVISTFAKGGTHALVSGASPPGIFLAPGAIRTDDAGNVYVADSWNVFRVDSQGTTHLVAGVFHACGFSGDGGPAISAHLCQPWDVVRDAAGNLYIADSNNNRIRRVEAATGIITTVAGSGPPNGFERYGQGAFSGDGGPATQARLNTPYGIALDASGNLFIADTSNGRIRKVDRSGTITTFVQDIYVTKMAFDRAGTLFAAGAEGVHRIDSAGRATLLTKPPVSGAGPLGDGGPASQATFVANSQASGIAIDAEGNVYVVDDRNYRLRAIRSIASASTASANHTALWWNPAESGWGLNVNHQGDTLFATLFTYDASGSPMWLVMSDGSRQGTSDSFSGDLYRTTGPAFNAVPFTPIGGANITRVGTMSLGFSGDTGTLVYSFDGATVTKTIRKQQFGSRVATCQPTTLDRSALANYQDLWWNPAESGWGLNIAHQDDMLFATLFTYDPGGRGMWLVMSAGTRQGDGSYLGDLYRTTGPAFNAQPFMPITAANITRVGAMRLRFPSGTNGSLEYSVAGAAVTKAIARQVFSSPVPACGS